jgi:circadian clock protein KaiC
MMLSNEPGMQEKPSSRGPSLAVRRAISVVKKRTGPHEPTIRELRIGPNRLQVGKVLVDFDGVLTGVPRYHGASGPLLSNGHGATQ